VGSSYFIQHLKKSRSKPKINEICLHLHLEPENTKTTQNEKDNDAKELTYTSYGLQFVTFSAYQLP
jgi:hypothetical protein